MAKKKFVDSDLNKDPNSLEEMFGGVLTSLKDTPDQQAPAIIPEADPVTPALDTPAEAIVPATPAPIPEVIPKEPIAEPAPQPAEPAPAGPSPEVADDVDAQIKLMEEILFGTDDLADAAQKITDAVAKGDDVSAETARLNSELETYRSKEKGWKEAMDRAVLQIDEYESNQAISEIEGARKNKLYEIIQSDDSLKTLVALKKRASENPVYEQEYKDYLDEFYEQSTGKNISSMVSSVNRNDKEKLGGGNYQTPGEPDSDSLFGGILTDL